MNDIEKQILDQANKIVMECWYNEILDECGDLLYTDRDVLIRMLIEDPT